MRNQLRGQYDSLPRNRIGMERARSTRMSEEKLCKTCGHTYCIACHRRHTESLVYEVRRAVTELHKAGAANLARDLENAMYVFMHGSAK